MLNWLRPRSASYRRAARPAMPAAAITPEPVLPPMVVEKPTPAPAPVAVAVAVEEELPPPFFADDDPAFLDFGDPTPPAPLSPEAKLDAEVRLAKALAELPAFPEAGAKNRTDRLLEILRTLDRIAGDVCHVLDEDRPPVETGPSSVARIPR